LSETIVQSSLGMFDCPDGARAQKDMAHTSFADHPFVKIRL
jgi:hypothetical protein